MEKNRLSYVVVININLVLKKLRTFEYEELNRMIERLTDHKSVAQKIPENILQEDPKLLMWYDQALTRMGGKP